jgi:hypothetical protein
MMRGSVWLFLVIFGYFWLFLVIFGYFGDGRVVRLAAWGRYVGSHLHALGVRVQFPFLSLETEHLSVHLGDLILRALRGGF